MDPTMIAQQPTGLEAWITNNQALIQIVLWTSQVLFWVGMLLFVGYAVATYKRYTNWQMGIGKAGALREEAEAQAQEPAPAEETVSVEEFVE